MGLVGWVDRGRARRDPRLVRRGGRRRCRAGAGSTHSLVLKSDGTVWAWGDNTNGALGVGNTADQGTVLTCCDTPVQVHGLTTVTAVAAGDFDSLALTSAGTVWAWGDNTSGQLGDGTMTARDTPVQVGGLTRVTAIAAGSTQSLALKSDGTVSAWGNNTEGELGDGTTTERDTPLPVAGLTSVIAIAAGLEYSLALRKN